jgi:uncharacterized membrane protein YqjE
MDSPEAAGAADPVDAPASASSPPAGGGSPAGLFGAARALLDVVFGSVVDRVELFAIELHEEKQRLIRTLVWLTAFVASLVLAAVFVGAAILVAFWPTAARVPIAVALAGLYSVAAIVAGIGLKRCLEQPRPLAATVAELRTDQTCLQPKK